MFGVDGNDEIVGETRDPEGRRVVLLARVWHDKVLPEHPEMMPFVAKVLQAVIVPEHVEADREYAERVHYCVRGIGPSKWLLVVVSYEQVPARIVTAFARRKDPSQWDTST
jgi:hypothetical protein